MNSGLISQEESGFISWKYSPLKQKIQDPIQKKKVLIIAGPTATGKTSLSIKLAKILKGEIISADSMQVYRGMDIGTAKIKQAEMEGIPHHLIDVCDIQESFNVVDFYNEATKKCQEIQARGNVPIVVGGTGFYIHSLIYGPPKGPPSSIEIREKLERDIEKFGAEALYEKLKEFDPDYALTISHGDKQKIIRALEIITLTKKKVSEFPNLREATRPLNFSFHAWFIYYPKEILYPRIEMRCDQMIQQKFENEVQTLVKQGLEKNISAAQAIGYRQYLSFLSTSRSNENWEKFVLEFKQASKRYAKRQFTWFKKEQLFRWLSMAERLEEEVIDVILQEFDSALP